MVDFSLVTLFLGDINYSKNEYLFKAIEVVELEVYPVYCNQPNMFVIVN